MTNIIGVKIKRTGSYGCYLKEDIDLKLGDHCVVESERGVELGVVVKDSDRFSPDTDTSKMKSVIRKAGENDLITQDELADIEHEAFMYCKDKIEERQLEMKLVVVNFTLDKSKAIFYFTADGRIDFRELVKDLAHRFHIRIEMRQIGVRDEAKMIGGISTCGRELCCTSFLNKFAPVSIKMAKAQQLTLNPSRISGSCGRLMCCISYEKNCDSCDKKGHKKHETVKAETSDQ